jgi:O-antigen/teichoic acid export membrane protein
MVYTLQTTNLNILKVKGRPDIFLNLEIIKKIVGIILILLGLHWGIIGLVSGLVVSSYISFFLNSHYSGRLINYPVIEQLTDIAPYFLVSILMAALAYLVKFLFQLNDWGLLLIQSGVAIVSYVLLTLLFRLEAFKELRAISSLLKNK